MIERIETSRRMSQITIHNDTVYLAGQVADDPEADVTTQTRQVLAKIDRLLDAAGADRSRLLSATIWLSDIRYFAEMNGVWDEWVLPDHAPARACVEARLATPDFKVEIGVLAAR